MMTRQYDDELEQAFDDAIKRSRTMFWLSVVIIVLATVLVSCICTAGK